MKSDYTPDEHELIRGFTARHFDVVERGEHEAFSDYLSRASIRTAQIQIASESAARRAIAKVKAAAWDECFETIERDARIDWCVAEVPKNPFKIEEG